MPPLRPGVGRGFGRSSLRDRAGRSLAGRRLRIEWRSVRAPSDWL